MCYIKCSSGNQSHTLASCTSTQAAIIHSKVLPQVELPLFEMRWVGCTPLAGTCPTPDCWTVLLSLLHKHLQHAHVVACQLVAEGQAQIAVIPGWGEWQDQPSPSPCPLVAYLRNGEVSSTWGGK